MANVLDLRRRIRSVKNTRQITKAMKMVSAAKLRRAQERALQSRPFSQMLTNVLQSVVSRAELFDPETGLPLASAAARNPAREDGAHHHRHRRSRAGGCVQLQRLESAVCASSSISTTRTSMWSPLGARAATSCAAASLWAARIARARGARSTRRRIREHPRQG